MEPRYSKTSDDWSLGKTKSGSSLIRSVASTCVRIEVNFVRSYTTETFLMCYFSKPQEKQIYL